MTEISPDGTGPLAWVGDELAALDVDGLRRTVRTVTPLPRGRCEIGGRELINFASNDYLGLAGDPRLADAAAQVAHEAGTGARASALVVGRTDWHERLERRIAQFEGTEAALLFPTGYAANLGAITALVGSGDVVLGDRLNHASLIDGCRLSGAAFRVYPHGDVDRLDHELGKHSQARRRLIVTDGLFSMDGDFAPLRELCDVAEHHNAMLLVDEAHGTGVLGRSGRGCAEHLGVEDRIPVRVGTLSKAVGSQGGFVAGSQALIHWLRNHARTQFFSTALAPPACAAAIAAFDVIDNELQRRQRLSALARTLRERLSPLGVQNLGASESPIVPVILRETVAAVGAARKLEEAGLLVAAIRPPSVSRGTARLRISLTAEHTDEDVDCLVESLSCVLSTPVVPTG